MPKGCSEYKCTNCGSKSWTYWQGGEVILEETKVCSDCGGPAVLTEIEKEECTACTAYDQKLKGIEYIIEFWAMSSTPADRALEDIRKVLRGESPSLSYMED